MEYLHLQLNSVRIKDFFMSFVKVLGAYGGKSINKSLTSFLITENIVIDAGNLITPLGEKAKYIDHIFLSHSHLDHIIDIFFLIDNFYEYRKKPIKIYGLKDTLNSIKEHLLNWNIWPDFSEIELMNTALKSIELIEIEVNQIYRVNGFEFKPIKTNHTTGSCGYVIKNSSNNLIFITSDTYTSENIINELNKNLAIKTLLIEISFPSRFDKLAKDSKHLTPQLLKDELEKINRDDIDIYINHIKPNYEQEIKEEFYNYKLKDKIKFLYDDFIIEY